MRGRRSQGVWGLLPSVGQQRAMRLLAAAGACSEGEGGAGGGTIWWQRAVAVPREATASEFTPCKQFAAMV